MLTLTATSSVLPCVAALLNSGPLLTALKCMSSAAKPEMVYEVPLAGAASVSLPGSHSAPLLLQLPERQWGPAVSLSTAHVASLAGATPKRLAVVRDVFSVFSAPPIDLHKLIAPQRGGVMAVSAAVAQSHNRVVVDEYLHTGEGYALQETAVDLLRFLRRNNMPACLVPDVETAATHNAVLGAARGIMQSSNQVVMVSPTAFGFNEQAAQDNSFMHHTDGDSAGGQLTRQVLKEFAGLYHQLSEVAGVKVHLFQHSLAHGTPDATFCNNWFSTHPKGEAAGGVDSRVLVLYPMKCPNRAAERRADIIAAMQHMGCDRVVDLSGEEAHGRYFEGTGVLVLDRVNGVAYVNLSERAHEDVAKKWVEALGYNDLVTFRSSDLRGKAVYHTNVMMAVGSGVAVVCADSVKDDKERRNLLAKLRQHHEVVQISLEQMDALCGNVLELQDGRGLPVLAMSTQAYNAFTPDQRQALRRHVADLIHSPIDTLEKIGGGGVRCTLGEWF